MPFLCKQVRRASYFSRPIPLSSCPLVLAAIFVPQGNEKWYDLGGSLGFLSATVTSLYYPTLKAKFWQGAHVPFLPLSSFAPRQLLLTTVLGIWTIRLGSFLVQARLLFPALHKDFDNRTPFTKRAIKAGGDSRFDEVKHQPGTFTAFWMAQGLSLVPFLSTYPTSPQLHGSCSSACQSTWYV